MNRPVLRFLIREPAEVYHAQSNEYLSAHALADFRRCPALYRKKQLGLIPERESGAFLVGRAAHTLILEGRERYEREYIVGGPVNPKTGQPFGPGTKAFAEWGERIGKAALSDDQAALVEQMAAAVRGHELARELLADGVAEGVIRCTYADTPCQARIDWIHPLRGIVDLKTADSLDGFEAAITTFGYLHQLAFYRALLAQATGELSAVHLIAVEKREPFRCGVWRLAPAVLDAAARQNESAIRELAQCQTTGVWPTRFEELRSIERL